MKVQDLTKGSIPNHLLRLAAPLILGNIMQQLYNTIDAIVIGRYVGKEAFAAIGLSGSVMNLFLFAIIGACTGISILFAQQYGSKDMDSFRSEHFLSLTFGMLFTTLLGIVGAIMIPTLLSMIQTPDSLRTYASDYLTIILMGLPAAFLYNLYSSLLRAVGNTKASLFILLIAIFSNVGLDLLFVTKFQLGISGAAWATILAQILSAIMCILYMYFFMPHLLFTRNYCNINTQLLRKTMHLAFVTGLHQSGLYIGKLFVQGSVNTAGSDMIAAYTATTRIEGFANSFGDSGAVATSIIVAQNYGAGKQERSRLCFRESMFLLFIFGSLCSILMYFTADYTVSWILGSYDGPAFDSACQYIRTISIFYTLCFMGNAFAGYFDGCGWVSIPFIGAASHITMRIILSWLFIHKFGLNAVAVATGIGWIWVNLFWTVIYRRKTASLKQSVIDTRDSLTPQSHGEDTLSAPNPVA
ncbi:MAG: MATE family efflux transporter [bacterium]|nr:MATE family efflux transporter [bacterium]